MAELLRILERTYTTGQTKPPLADAGLVPVRYLIMLMMLAPD
jgi:hypothetical protein